MALCGLKCCCAYTLHRDWTTLTFVRAPREQTLPVILSPDAVRTMRGRVRRLSSRVCLSTIASCGRRLPEGTHLQVPHLDRSRMLVHVRRGKGGNDRDVPLPHRTLQLLREYWGTHRQPVLIFPAPGRGGIGLSTSTAARPKRSMQGAFREALQQSSVHQPASVHTLRHSWATHRLEAGVTLRRMQASLGHASPTTTRRSTHLTVTAEALGSQAVNRLMSDR
jgi:integrase/recombinase XerD